MEEDIKILEEFIKDYEATTDPLEQSAYFEEVPAKTIRNIINKYKEQEKIIELAIDELYLFNAYDCDYSDLKEHTCTKNDDDTVEIQKAKCKKCIRKIIEKKAKGG